MTETSVLGRNAIGIYTRLPNPSRLDNAIVLDLDLVKQLHDFRLEVALRVGNEVVVLFGPSGSGKSLTLQCVAGLLSPDRGWISINGRLVLDTSSGVALSAQDRRVGYVPQGYALFPHLTVAQNIAYGLHAESTIRKEKRVLNMLALMRLEGLGDYRPHQLSGGQQQRVALARALVIEPEILLLDEPFAALDSAIRSKLRQELMDLCRGFTGTTLLVTHDLSEAYVMGDKIAVIDQGRLLQVGRREDVLYRPRTRAVARFTLAKNIFTGRVVARSAGELQIAVEESSRFVVVAPPYCVAIGEKVELCIRPDDIMLVRHERREDGSAHENLLHGRIVAQLAQGTEHVLFFKLGDGLDGGYRDYDLEIQVSRHAFERLNLAQEHHWTVSLKKSAIHVIGKEMH